MNDLTLWLDGAFRERSAPHVDLFDHALHYGTGVFEGIRIYDGAHGPAVFRLGDHMARFARGTAMLRFEADTDAMSHAAGELCRRNGFRNAYVRPLAWLGGGSLHLDVEKLTARQAVAVLPWTSHLGEAAVQTGISVMTSTMSRNPRSALPPLKICGGYVNSCLAKLEATHAGFDEALFVDGDLVCEATGENVFLVQGDQVVAVEHPDALPGITRDTIITLTGAVSRPVSRAELASADEIFLCGTSAEVTAVRRFDDRELAIGPVTKAIAATYQDVVHGRDTTHGHWLTPIETLFASAAA